MVKQLLRTILMLVLLLCAHGAPSGGWLSGVCWLSGAEAHAAQALVFETGQTTSYATGDDGALRPGVAWPAPRFTDKSNGTVADNLTGLIWLKNANCFGTKTWQDSLSSANNLASGQCGLSDGSAIGAWRLPNAKELESLVDLQNTSPALPVGHPFSNVQADLYWSSSSGATGAWIVSMSVGIVVNSSYGFNHCVWPVRGGQSGTLGSLTIFPASKDFGTISTNATSSSQTFTITNRGMENLVVSSITLTGGDSGMFALATGDGTGGSCGATPTIAPEESCAISATFTPTSAGAKSTTLRIISNDPVTPNKDAVLSGTGTLLPSYTIGTSVVGGHGGITCDSPVISGTTSHCVISHDAGYHLATFTDNTVNKLASVVANAYNIPAVTANHAIAGTFAIDFYTVTFNSNGGSAVSRQYVVYSGTANTPVAPTRTGYSFAGWYSNAALTTPFSFSTPITSNITLYAKWTLNTYTVSFNSNGGSAVASQHIAYNGTATAPAIPTRTGYTFAGWYSNAALTTSFSFSTPITSDITLYAKWTPNIYTVNFNSNGGSAVTSQYVAYSGTANMPAAPTRAGYTFAGWYSNAALTTVFSFSTPITSDITLYAKWTVSHAFLLNSNDGSAVGGLNMAHNGIPAEFALSTKTG